VTVFEDVLMKTVGSPIVAAIVTAIMTLIVTAAALQVTPAAAEVLTVCGAPSGGAGTMQPSILASPLQRLGTQDESDIDSLLALWRDEKGFDILLHWGENDEYSLREQGAEIIGSSPTLDFVHLMVARTGHLEHFLFSLDERGSGELIRSAAEGEAGQSAAVSSNATCIRPNLSDRRD
jgi:hypothetical protein